MDLFKKNKIKSMKNKVAINIYLSTIEFKKRTKQENQDGGIGRHTAPPHTTRTDRKSNGKEV